MGWRIVPLLMLYVGLAHFNRISISVAGTGKIIPSGELTTEQMGYVYSAFLFTYTLTMIPAGWFIDRRGPSAGWIVLGIGSTLGTLLTGFAGVAFAGSAFLLTALLIIRCLMAPTNAPLHPAAARLVANWVPARSRALANGLVTFAAMVGLASTYIVFGMLIDVLDWPKAFFVTGILTLLVALLWWRVGGDAPTATVNTPRPATGHDASAWRTLLTNRSLVCLTLSYGAIGYFQYLFFYWAEYYFKEIMHLSRERSRDNTTLLVMTMGAGMILGGRLSDWAVATFGKRRGTILVPMSGLLLGALATWIGTSEPDGNRVAIYFAVAMGCVGLCEASYWTLSITLGGKQGGTAAAIMNTSGNAFGAIAPALAPVLAASEWGWKGGLISAAVVCVIGALLWFGVNAEEKESI